MRAPNRLILCGDFIVLFPKTVLPLCMIALTVGLLLVLNRQWADSDIVPEPAAESQRGDTLHSSPAWMPLESDTQVPTDDPVSVELPEADSEELNPEPALKGEAALSELLPVWMHEEGVAPYYEAIEVVGEPITRCRARYRWDNGASMEYELTDIGPTPKPELMKSLGFNFNQGSTESETGYTIAYELEQGISMIHEYDEAAGEGSLQILVKDRFLLEVQLEGFETEAFEDVMENHLPLDKLLQF